MRQNLVGVSVMAAWAARVQASGVALTRSSFGPRAAIGRPKALATGIPCFGLSTRRNRGDAISGFRRKMTEQQKSQSAGALSGRAIVTIIGSDRVGIIAGIANVIAEANVNILDISQSVIREFFTMIMMVDLGGATIAFEDLSDRLQRKGAELAVRVEVQREEIFKTMHRI
jgi:ACT domain-containing protein